MSDMNSFYLFGGAAIAATMVVVIKTRSHQVADPLALVDMLHPHQLTGLDKDIDNGTPPEDHWKKTRRYKGLWRRWRNRAVLVRLAQVRGTMEVMKPEELMQILALSSELHTASWKALVSAPFRSVLPKWSQEKNWSAIHLYAKLAYAVHALYADDDVPLCAQKLAIIL